MRSIFDHKPQFKRINLNPFSGDFNLDFNNDDLRNLGNIATGGAILGPLGAQLGLAGFDFMDPMGTRAAMQQQQNLINEFRNQQEQLIRNEQNRRWQTEISNSWAAYGAQRRSMVMSSGNVGSSLSPMGATDIYLGGR